MASSCTRCGKQRVVIKSWSEVIGTATITHTEAECPDPDCQKAVNSGIARQKRQREIQEKDKLQREQERLALKRNIS